MWHYNTDSFYEFLFRCQTQNISIPVILLCLEAVRVHASEADC